MKSEETYRIIIYTLFKNIIVMIIELSEREYRKYQNFRRGFIMPPKWALIFILMVIAECVLHYYLTK